MVLKVSKKVVFHDEKNTKKPLDYIDFNYSDLNNESNYIMEV